MRCGTCRGSTSPAAEVEDSPWRGDKERGGARSVAAPRHDAAALVGANAVTVGGSAGASPSRGRVASVAGNSPRDDALVAWLAESAGANRNRWNSDFEQIEDGTCGASGTEFDGGLRDRPLLRSFDAVFASVGGGV